MYIAFAVGAEYQRKLRIMLSKFSGFNMPCTKRCWSLGDVRCAWFYVFIIVLLRPQTNAFAGLQ
jgi:hypothetical protein